MHKVAEQEAERNPEAAKSLDVFRRMFSLTADEFEPAPVQKEEKKKKTQEVEDKSKKEKEKKRKRKSKSASQSRSAFGTLQQRRERYKEKQKEEALKAKQELEKAKVKPKPKPKSEKKKVEAVVEVEERGMSPTAQVYSKLMQGEPLVVDDVATDQLRRLVPEVRERRVDDIVEAPSIRVDTPEFCMKTLFDENFRRKNRDFVTALAMERNSGYPFRRFLRRRNKHKLLFALAFWCDVQQYLNTYSDHMHERDQLKLYRVKLLILHYLKIESKLFPDKVKDGLRALMLRQQGVEYVRAAQDQVSKCLLEQWREFMVHDRKQFESKCYVIHTPPDFPSSSTIEDDVQIHPVIRYMYTQHASGKAMELPTDPERRSTIAMQILFDMFTEPETTINMYFLHMDDLEPWDEESNYGTLEVKPLVIVHRRDLVEEMARLAFNRRQRLKYLRMLRAVRNAVKRHRQSVFERRMQEKAREMEVPSFLKAMKKNGQLVERARLE